MECVDAHAHITGDEFTSDLQEVIQRARAAGLSALLNIGSGPPLGGCFQKAIELACAHADVFAGIGVHPHDSRHYSAEVEKLIVELFERSARVVGLGEIGLDYHYDLSPRETQREVFARQLRLACELNTPVIIHTRDAEEDTLTILKESPRNDRGGMIHCFSGSEEFARAAIDIGFYISIAGNVTFKNAENLRKSVTSIPIGRLLTETDSPYMSPVPFRGRRNEPSRVVEVVRCLATLKGASIEEVSRCTRENFYDLFRLEKDPGPSPRQ